MSKIQVKAHTSFLGHTGYNNHSKNFFTNLNKYIPTRVRNYSYCNDLSYLKPEELALVIEQEWIDHPYKIGSPFIRDPEAMLVNIVLNESHHYFFYDKYESPMIAYNVWEATRQIPEYFNRILEYDQFWCPTEWQRKCTIEQGYPADRVKVVHEGVNGNIFKPITGVNPLLQKKHFYKKYSIPYDTFTFMIFGRWDYRKFTTEMVQAFCEEFKDDDDVMLILSADNPFSIDGMKTAEERMVHHKILSDKIKVVHFPPREDYAKFLQHGNCLLSCSRSEGWNLPLMEALACGTPSIASNWGGHLEFADGIAQLVDVPKELPPKEVFMMDNKHDIGVWGEPDFDHLKKVMRDVYNNYADAKEYTVEKSTYIREKYTWDNAAKTAVRHIRELYGKIISIPKHQKLNKDFNVTFEIVDGKPRVVFGSPKEIRGKVFAVIQSEDGKHHHENWFETKPNINYWIDLNNILNVIKFELFDESLNLIHSESKLAKDITIVKQEAYGDMELYQDQYVNGDIISKGKRDCASRYEAMRTVFNKYKRPFTILDVGANFGYYSIRAASDYDTISVMVENKDAETRTLVNLCDKNKCKDKLIVLKTTMSIENLEELSKCEHFDVVLALNVIHHFPTNQVLKACHLFTKLGDNLILETPPLEDYDACGQENLDIILNYFNGKEGTKLGSFERHTSKTLSDMIWFKTDRKLLQWPYYGYERLFEKDVDKDRLKNRDPNNIISDFKTKHIQSPRRNEVNEWIPGINLRTYLEMKGEYPIITDIIENIKYRKIQTGYKWDDTNNDINTHNLILNGSQIYMIDFNDKDCDNPMNGDDWHIKFVVEDIKDYIEGRKETKNKLKLNLGCGNDIRIGYINADKYNNTGNVDIKCDLNSLPFLDNSLDEIFTSHVFEHIGLNEVHAVVEEWKRVLKENGELVMRIPNLEHEVNIWLNTPDENKWDEVSRIFGGQSYTGNFHFQGFNPGSLKSFLERFNFEVLDIHESNRGFGNEINIRAKKIPNVKKLNVHYISHFVDGPFVEVKGPPRVKDFFIADFYDVKNNSSLHQATIRVNHWIRTHRKYFTDWLIQIRRNGKIEHEHRFNLKDKRVLISFDSKSIGDTIAWIPVVEEFRKKHQCEVWLSTFWNKLFDECEDYKDLNWIPPGDVVNNLYASYIVGCFDNDVNKNKTEWRLIPLQQIAADILGIDLEKELVASIVTQDARKKVTEEPYIAISEFSTFQCKLWNYPGGWQEIVDYINELGYKVVVISKEKTNLKNIIDRTDRTMSESINTIKHAEFFIGVSSGPAWLSWALKTPAIIISGCTEKWLEFKNKIQRVINEDVCHGCFNSIEHSFDRGEWNYCPRHKGTVRQFECAKRIIPDMVKHSIDEIIKRQYSRID